MKSRSVRTAATATRFRRKPLITALEPRLLLDGAAVATAVELATDVDFQEQSTDGTTDTTVHSASAEDAVHFTEVPAPAAPEIARREVAFVDTQVEDYQTLVASMADGVEIFLIDAGSNGLEQMLAHLQGQSGIDAIHVYSHGDVGQLTLGSLTLDAGNLSENANLLAQLGETLSSDADLMLYGCYVGGDSAGQSFIEDDGGVDVLGGEVERRRPRRVVAEVHHDAAMRGEEARQPRHQPAGAEGRQDGQIENAAGAAEGHGVDRRRGEPRQRLAHLARIGAAGRRQHHALAHALEELEAELRLHRRHLAADGSLGQVELLRRLGEGQVPRRRLEGGERCQGRQGKALVDIAHLSFRFVMNS